MTDKQKLKEAIKVIKTLRKDAEMALSGEWQITGYPGMGLDSDSAEGFEAQIQNIDRFLNSIKDDTKIVG
jgi:hypothetical protein